MILFVFKRLILFFSQMINELEDEGVKPLETPKIDLFGKSLQIITLLAIIGIAIVAIFVIIIIVIFILLATEVIDFRCR